MKVGDTVVCILSDYKPWLTRGATYIIESIREETFAVTDDQHEYWHYDQSYFIPHKPITKQRIPLP